MATASVEAKQMDIFYSATWRYWRPAVGLSIAPGGAMGTQCVKGEFPFFSTWALFSTLYVSKKLIVTSLFQFGSVLTEIALFTAGDVWSTQKYSVIHRGNWTSSVHGR